MVRIAILALGATALCAPAAAEVWVDITPAGPAPAPREEASSIYDPVGHRAIVFGGRTDGGDVNDVWAFDLTLETWSDITPATGLAPTGRFTHNAVYDSVEHRMIIWSGEGSDVFFNDVWAFDLTTHVWSEFQPPPPLPSVRYGTAAVFDPVARDLVTFGGFTHAGRFDDTWRFDVDLVQWTDVTTPLGRPLQRCLHSAIYDVLNRRMIMYGGSSMGALDDIWSFNLVSNAWTEITPAVRPEGRFYVAMDYDSARHRALVFGGFTATDYTAEVWEFDLDGGTWSQLFPMGTPPAPRSGAAPAYVVTEDRLLAFGGSTASGYRNDVWSLELSPGGQITFPWTIRADNDDFTWPVPANVTWVRGALASVSTYAFDVVDSETHATSFTDASVPLPGEGFYFLVRLDGPDASWQTVPGAEPGRDDALP